MVAADIRLVFLCGKVPRVTDVMNKVFINPSERYWIHSRNYPNGKGKLRPKGPFRVIHIEEVQERLLQLA